MGNWLMMLAGALLLAIVLALGRSWIEYRRWLRWAGRTPALRGSVPYGADEVPRA